MLVVGLGDEDDLLERLAFGEGGVEVECSGFGDQDVDVNLTQQVVDKLLWQT
jgi:hypothetical protein